MSLEIDDLERLLDDDGYPTDAALKQIREWPHTDFGGLVEFVIALWRYPIEAPEESGVWEISTSGWSGNESIIDSLQGNRMFWALCWQSSRRGGHYEFHVRHLEKAR